MTRGIRYWFVGGEKNARRDKVKVRMRMRAVTCSRNCPGGRAQSPRPLASGSVATFPQLDVELQSCICRSSLCGRERGPENVGKARVRVRNQGVGIDASMDEFMQGQSCQATVCLPAARDSHKVADHACKSFFDATMIR